MSNIQSGDAGLCALSTMILLHIEPSTTNDHAAVSTSQRSPYNAVYALAPRARIRNDKTVDGVGAVCHAHGTLSIQRL